MRIVLAAVGSRGDVAPVVALAEVLQTRGHDVTMLTHTVFRGLVPESIPLVEIDSDPAELLGGPAAQAVRRVDPRAMNRSRDHFARFLQASAEPARQVIPGADCLVASTFAIPPVDVAINHGVPVVRAHMFPQPTRPGGVLPLLPFSWLLPRPARRLAFTATHGMENYLAGVSGAWRRGRLTLSVSHPVGLTTTTAGSLYAYSPAVAAAPDPGSPATGWWWPASPGDVSSRASRALTFPGPVVAAGFGSLPAEASRHLVETMGEVMIRLGGHAIIQTSTTHEHDERHITLVDGEPHEHLFPRVAAVVHHGGAGTSGAALRAGVPAVVVPYFGDQFYWAHRLHRLRVAASPVLPPRMTVTGMTRRLEHVLSDPVRYQARMLGEQVAAENGTLTAALWLEDRLPG